MTDVDVMIRREIEDAPDLDVKALTVEMSHRGFFRRRHYVSLGGSVKTDHDRSKIDTIARHHAGDAYRVVNEVTIKEP